MTERAYAEVLADARLVGASRADEEGLLALLCYSGALQRTCGAVSSKLVFEGARRAGLTARALTLLLATDPGEVEKLQWRMMWKVVEYFRGRGPGVRAPEERATGFWTKQAAQVFISEVDPAARRDLRIELM